VRNPKPLPPPHVFYGRLARSVSVAFVLLGGSLALGVVGYMIFGRMPLVDAVLEASMILAGMGPVEVTHETTNRALKWFSSAYAIFSGVMFLTSVSVMLGPVVHRFLHRFHLEEEDRSR
jgi:hypothetical protein